MTCLPTVLVTCPWLFVLLPRALSREACFDLVFELGRGEGWVLLAKALGISANRMFFIGPCLLPGGQRCCPLSASVAPLPATPHSGSDRLLSVRSLVFLQLGRVWWV